jgi:membrane AbrB-like protein
MRLLGRWCALLVSSVLLITAFMGLGLSGAPLLGAMLAGILQAICRKAIDLPAPLFMLAQGLVGLLIARGVPASIIAEMLHAWPVLLTSIVAVVGASAGLGYLMAVRQTLPGTTAIWGFFPGGSSVMVLMAADYGADARLVAFMQYLRVLVVALTASLVARIWVPNASGGSKHTGWFEFGSVPSLASTVVFAVVASWIGRKLRIPAGSLLVPMFAGILLQDTGVLVIDLPQVLLIAAYAVIGWSVGLRFTTAVLSHALGALPRVLASMVVLIAACGALAAVLTVVVHVDPMTAYFATSPGGIDSIAILSATTAVDMPFVMAMQTARMLAVLTLGPAIARWLAKRVNAAVSRTGA